jgi:hypothetical protein
MVAETGRKGEPKPALDPGSVQARMKIFMLINSITPQQIADATGYQRQYIYQNLCGSIVCKAARKKIVAYLGVDPWSEDFDPYTANKNTKTPES